MSGRTLAACADGSADPDSTLTETGKSADIDALTE